MKKETWVCDGCGAEVPTAGEVTTVSAWAMEPRAAAEAGLPVEAMEMWDLCPACTEAVVGAIRSLGGPDPAPTA